MNQQKIHLLRRPISRVSDESRIFNNTLGFERILVVSTGPSWRSEGLLEAADFTGLDVEIPQQPKWSTEEVDAFRSNSTGPERLGPGEAKCWLGHINALSHVVKNNWATVLVLEDDADWDIALKRQLALVAPAIRTLTNSTIHEQSSGKPYGDAWDLLWVGHCGDYIPPGAMVLPDDSLPLDGKYRENDGRYTVLGKPQMRMVHVTTTPICTYAYALTGDAAKKIYNYSKEGVQKTITEDLKRWCQAGFLRCVTVNPELFHHHKKAGKATSEIALAEGWAYNVWSVDFTANIRYSARCNSKSARLITCMDEFNSS